MDFVQTAFLGAAAAVAVPIILHLINYGRPRKVELGTIRFLSEIIRENVRRRKLKRYILLAMRIAAVLLFAMLFARPYLLATENRSSGRQGILLIDRSASMSLVRDGDSLLDAAIDQAREVIRASGGQTHWELAFFDRDVDAVAESGDDSVTLAEAALAEERSPQSATNYGAAFAWARDLCLRHPHAETNIYLFTDMQRSGLEWTEVDPFPAETVAHVTDLGRDEVNNVSIVDVKPSGTLVRPGERVRWEVLLFDHGPFALDDLPVRLILTSGGRTVRLNEKLSLGADQSGSVSFEAASLAPGFWEGVVEVDVDDDLSFDNVRYTGVLVSPQKRVLILDGGEQRDRYRETWLLENALRLAPPGESYDESLFVARTHLLSDPAPIPPFGDYDLIVLSNMPAIEPAVADRLRRFVAAGGGLLVFSGDRVDDSSLKPLADAGLVPGTFEGIQRTRDLPFRWQSWEAEHPALEPFADPQHGDLRRLTFSQYTKFKPDASARVIASFGDTSPALIESRIGKGKMFWFTSALSRDWGRWSGSRLFLPLVHQLLADLCGLSGDGPVREVTIGVESGDESQSDRKPGVVKKEGYWEVTNLSSRESETDRFTKKELADRFQIRLAGKDSQAEEDDSPRVRNAGLDLRADEIWQWVLLGLMILLCGEMFLANRTTS